jgi:hypothetical protein
MGNCAGCIFFTCIDPIARSGKGTAHIETASVRRTKAEVNRGIRVAKRDKEKTTWIEFANSVYPPEILADTADYFGKKGYTIRSTKLDARGIRWDISWQD